MAGEEIDSLLSLQRVESTPSEEEKKQRAVKQGRKGKPKSRLNPPVDYDMLDTLTSMGFIRYEAEYVLETNGNNLEQAIEVLTAGAVNVPPPT